MKKIILITAIICSQISFAQLDIIGLNLYGRIQYPNYDPVIENTIYASTAGKHIVVSKDNGGTWEVLYSYPSSEYNLITTLKIHNDNELSFTLSMPGTTSNKIYILNKTTGLITREYNVPLPIGAVSSRVYDWDFYDDDTVIAILNYGDVGVRSRVYYTNDGGDNWDMIYYNMDHETIFAQDVAISPTNPKKLFIARMGGFFDHVGGLYISDNAGQTWIEKHPNVDFNAITFHPDNPNDILVGTWLTNAPQNLYRSLDNGDNWNIIDPNWPIDVASNAILDIQYNPSDSNNIIVLGTSSIIRTFDNFQTKNIFNFQNEIENPNNYYYGYTASFNPFNTDEIIMTNNDYPLRSVDGGETVVKLKNPFFFSQLGQLNLFKNNTSKHLYYPVQNGYSHRNLNTQTETPYGVLPLQYFPFTTNKFYTDENLEGRIYAYFESTSFNGSGLGVSNDHGENIIGIPSPRVFLHAIASRPDNPNLLFCSLSDDYDFSSLFLFDITDPDNVQETEITLPAQGLLMDFHFDVNNPTLMWITLANSVYKSSDYGTTWVQQNNGLNLSPNDKIYQISQNPLNLNQLTLATNRGIFTSLNNGNSWSQMTNQEVHSVKHSDANNNHIVAVTFDTEFTLYALRYSNDAGVTWNQVPPSDLMYINSDNNSTVIDFIGNEAEVYIATYDLGILKYTIDLSTLSNPVFGSDNSYDLHPNPTSSIVYIHSSDDENVFTLTLFDTLGKKIKEVKNADSIELQELQSGMYFLRIQSNNGKIETHKIIKK